METVTVRWTSRKFWAAMVWEAVFVTLFTKGILPEALLLSFTWLLLGGYFCANLATWWIQNKGDVK